MKTLFKILFAVTALMVVLAMFGGFALLHHGGPDMHIVLNDDEMFLGSGFADWLGASIGLFVAAVVCIVVVPLVLLLGVALPLLIVGGVLTLVVAGLFAGVAGVGAVLGSPLILLGLLLFVVLRNRQRSAAAKSGSV